MLHVHWSRLPALPDAPQNTHPEFRADCHHSWPSPVSLLSGTRVYAAVCTLLSSPIFSVRVTLGKRVSRCSLAEVCNEGVAATGGLRAWTQEPAGQPVGLWLPVPQRHRFSWRIDQVWFVIV